MITIAADRPAGDGMLGIDVTMQVKDLLIKKQCSRGGFSGVTEQHFDTENYVKMVLDWATGLWN